MSSSEGSLLNANRTLLLLAAIVFISMCSRLYGLGRESLAPDELYTIPASIGRHYRFQSKFRQPAYPVSVTLYRNLLEPDLGDEGLGEVTDVLKRNVHVPLYFYFMHYWIRLFGTSEVALRFPSVIFGVLSIIAIFLLGRELFNPFVGLFSSMLLGLIPEQVYESTNARMYSLLILLVVLSTYSLILLVKRPSRTKYLLYGIISVAGLYTHYVYLFCLASQTLYVYSLFKSRKEIRSPSLVTQLLIGLSFAPWLFICWSQNQTSEEALSWVSGTLTGWEIFLTVIKQVAQLTSVPDAPLGKLSQLAALILIFFGIRSLLSARSVLLLLGLWVVIPVAGILLADALGGKKSITVTRYWVMISPALYLLMSVGAQQLADTFGEVKTVAALTTLLAVASFCTAGGGMGRPFDFKGLTRYVESQIKDVDKEPVLTEGSAAIPLALAYYGRRDLRVWRLNFESGEPSEQKFVEVMRAEAGMQGTVWLLTNQTGGAAETLTRLGFRLDESQGPAAPKNVYRYVLQ